MGSLKRKKFLFKQKNHNHDVEEIKKRKINAFNTIFWTKSENEGLKLKKILNLRQNFMKMCYNYAKIKTFYKYAES